MPELTFFCVWNSKSVFLALISTDSSITLLWASAQWLIQLFVPLTTPHAHVHLQYLPGVAQILWSFGRIHFIFCFGNSENNWTVISFHSLPWLKWATSCPCRHRSQLCVGLPLGLRVGFCFGWSYFFFERLFKTEDSFLQKLPCCQHNTHFG